MWAVYYLFAHQSGPERHCDTKFTRLMYGHWCDNKTTKLYGLFEIPA